MDIARGKRFAFGNNWARFLKHLDQERISLAEESLRKMLHVSSLTGQTFLDVGCGSGLFSLAARRLGARVRSFDYDPQSVACARHLKEKFFPQDDQWTIEQESILEQPYLATLGQNDIVYSWGVLHHTGALWEALANVVPLVKPGGQLFIAIYNDQGWMSDYWGFIKRQYNQGMPWKILIIAIHVPYFMMLAPVVQFAKGKFHLKRGMSRWHDFLDWLGGLPFEVASPDTVVKFYERCDFALQKLKTCGRRHGCNEYVLRRNLTTP
ncbi:MAG: class I SAM-dependent methyltransferase [Gammaproteobacteria bacterium]